MTVPVSGGVKIDIGHREMCCTSRSIMILLVSAFILKMSDID
jgi:hypothetical protein